METKTPVNITSQIITPNEEINSECNLPFEIMVGYTDDMWMKQEDSQTVSVILRHRTFIEIATDGGRYGWVLSLLSHMSVLGLS